MLQYYAMPKIIEFPGSAIFQQDCAPSPCAIDLRRHLDTEILQRRIARGGPIAWLARSPYLTLLGFFMWGSVKNCVSSVQIRSLSYEIND